MTTPSVQTYFARLTRLFGSRRPPPKIVVTCASGTRTMLEGAGLANLLDGSAEEIEEYNLTTTSEGATPRLVGIETWTYGRFANAIYSNMNALSAAVYLGLDHVVFCEAEGFLRDKILSYEGVTVYSDRSLLKADGWLLRGQFWNHLAGWPMITPAQQRRIAREVILPCLQPPTSPPHVPADELVIHMRGGDVFSGADVNLYYVQPPFAFYKKVVAKALADCEVTRVRIVTEDRSNPCLAPLEDHLRALTIPFTVQTLTLVDDFATLAAAENLAYGFGTFGPAACLLSDRIKRVFVFHANLDLLPRLNPWIAQHHFFVDREGAYMKPGDWRNDGAQRKQMLDYPDEAVVELAYTAP